MVLYLFEFFLKIESSFIISWYGKFNEGESVEECLSKPADIIDSKDKDALYSASLPTIKATVEFS